MMLLMMHQPHLHQPWRLDRCNPFILSGTLCWSALPCSVCGIGTLPCSVQMKNTMQLFMWQRDIVGVAHYIMDCFEGCLVPSMMLLVMHQLSFFISPGGWLDVIHSVHLFLLCTPCVWAPLPCSVRGIGALPIVQSC